MIKHTKRKKVYGDKPYFASNRETYARITPLQYIPITVRPLVLCENSISCPVFLYIDGNHWPCSYPVKWNDQAVKKMLVVLETKTGKWLSTDMLRCIHCVYKTNGAFEYIESFVGRDPSVRLQWAAKTSNVSWQSSVIELSDMILLLLYYSCIRWLGVSFIHVRYIPVSLKFISIVDNFFNWRFVIFSVQINVERITHFDGLVTFSKQAFLLVVLSVIWVYSHVGPLLMWWCH